MSIIKTILLKNNVNNLKTWIFLLLVTIGYIFTLNYSYIVILGDKIDEFPLNVNYLKMALASIIILIIFLRIDQFSKKPSITLFNVFFYITVIPMAVIYGCCNDSSLFFFSVCLATTMGLFIINRGDVLLKKQNTYIHEAHIFIPWIGVLIVGLLLLIQLYYYGFPTLDALNFSKVYEIRLHGDSLDSKVFNYIFNWSIVIILPMLLARKLAIGHYFGACVYIIVFVIFYLYSASKSIFFAVPLIIGIFILAKSGKTNFWFITLLGAGTGAVSLLALTGRYALYSYFIRRVMILPAFLKYLYYDFFVFKEKIGLSGTLIGSAFNKPFPYENGLGVAISKYYFNNDVMNSNTGFIAEGFYRGGYIGVFISVLLLAVILILVDRMARNTSYSFALAFCIYPIYSLNDTALIDSIVFGPMLVLVLILMFYSDTKMLGEGYEKSIIFKLCKTNIFSRFGKRNS